MYYVVDSAVLAGMFLTVREPCLYGRRFPRDTSLPESLPWSWWRKQAYCVHRVMPLAAWVKAMCVLPLFFHRRSWLRQYRQWQTAEYWRGNKILTVRTCYEEAGADYDSLLKRYRSDKLLEKYLWRFLEDTSFARLQDSMEKGDITGAFDAVHDLKGISLNMELKELYAKCAELTELLRDGHKRDCQKGYGDFVISYTVRGLQRSIHQRSVQKVQRAGQTCSGWNIFTDRQFYSRVLSFTNR